MLKRNVFLRLKQLDFWVADHSAVGVVRVLLYLNLIPQVNFSRLYRIAVICCREISRVGCRLSLAIAGELAEEGGRLIRVAKTL